MNSTIMEQTRYWMWSRSKFNPRPPPPPLFFNSPTTTTAMVCPTVDSSWEEQAFAEDSAGLLGGCIWPPRSYSCSFCQREFRSAQALGGHMNVHRRDRARLKQSSSSSSSPTDDTTSDPILYPNPNPNPSPNFPSYSSPVFTDLYADDPQRHPGPPIAVRMAGGLELKLGVESWKVGREGKKEEEEDGVVINSNKRKRSIDDIGMFTSATTTNKKHFSEVIKVNPGHVEELDLELRLGDPPKVKY